MTLPFGSFSVRWFERCEFKAIPRHDLNVKLTGVQIEREPDDVRHLQAARAEEPRDTAEPDRTMPGRRDLDDGPIRKH